MRRNYEVISMKAIISSIYPQQTIHEIQQHLNLQMPFLMLPSDALKRKSYYQKRFSANFSQNEEKKCSDETLFSLLTSGSTGPEKQIFFTREQIYQAAHAGIAFFPYAKDDHFLLSLPLHHIAGMMIFFRSLLSGGRLLTPPPQKKSPSLFSFILEEQIHHLSFVPMQLEKFCRFLEENSLRPCHLKTILIGGSKISPSLVQRALNLNLPISLSYGMTETCGMIAATKIGEKIPLHPQHQVMSSGKFLYNSSHFCLAEDKTLQISLPHKILTNDLAEIDESGNLFILGRKDEVIISGGENINPFEVERQICLAFPKISDVFVIGVPDDLLGEKAICFYQSSNLISEEDFKRRLKEVMFPYYIPKNFYSLDDEVRKNKIKVTRSSLKKLFKSL